MSDSLIDIEPTALQSAASVEGAKAALKLALSLLFLFFCFCPYVAFAPTDSDLQPYAFLLSLLLCAMGIPRGLPWECWCIAISPLAAMTFWLGDDLSFFGLRETLSFLSPLSIAIATVGILRLPQGREILRRFVVGATYVWLAAGLIEWRVDAKIFAMVIPNLSLDQSRGVAGLATEPSFYGIFCLFLMGLNYLCNRNSRAILIVLLFEIFVLAQSSVTILMILILLVYAVLILPSPRTILAVIAAGAFGAALFVYVLPYVQGLRAANLALQILSNPMAVLLVDQSINARVGHMIFPMLGFLDSFGAPHGYGDFYVYVMNKLHHVDFVWLGVLSPNMKIMSGYGAAAFELGWFGLFIPVGVAVSILRYYRGRIRMGILATLFVSTVMCFAVQLSLPLFGILLGWMIHESQERKNSAVGPVDDRLYGSRRAGEVPAQTHV